MDEPYRQPDGLARLRADLASATESGRPARLGAHRTAGASRTGSATRHGGVPPRRRREWSTLGAGPVDVTGRLIGGCVETVTNLAGTAVRRPPGWAERQEEGTIVYLEACGDDAFTICRNLHGLAARRLVRSRPGGGDRQHPGAGLRHR